MLIICPKCFAEYDVSAVPNLKKSQEYHCSNCNHIFVAEPQEYLSETESAPTVAGVMAAQSEKPFKMPRCLDEGPRVEPVALNPDLGYIPEEFKPVPAPKKKKKASVLVVFVYLAIIGAAGYVGYLNRNLIWSEFKGVWADSGLPALETPTPIVVPETNVLPPEPVAEKPAVIEPEQVAAPVAEPVPEQTAPVTPSVPAVAAEPVNPVALAVAERLSVAVAEPKAVPQSAAPATEKPAVDWAALKEILKIQDISYQLGPNEEGVNRLLIEGNLVNTDLAAVDTPDLMAVVYDKQDMVVARKHIVPSQKTVQGNTKEAFYTSIMPAPESVGRVEVNFEE